MSLRGLMFDRCDTFTLTVKKDRLQANWDDYAPKATNVRCQAQIQSAKSFAYYAQFGMEIDAMFFFDKNPGLGVYDLIVHDGFTYSVDGVRPVIKRKAWEARCIRYDPQRPALRKTATITLSGSGGSLPDTDDKTGDGGTTIDDGGVGGVDGVLDG